MNLEELDPQDYLEMMEAEVSQVYKVRPVVTGLREQVGSVEIVVSQEETVQRDHVELTDTQKVTSLSATVKTSLFPFALVATTRCGRDTHSCTPLAMVTLMDRIWAMQDHVSDNSGTKHVLVHSCSTMKVVEDQVT